MLDLRVSDTYQEILEEGIAEGKAEGILEGKRASILKFGARRLGTPSDSTQEALHAITSPEDLDRLIDRLLDVESWDELLQ